MSEKWRVALIILVAVLMASAGEALAAKGMKAASADNGVLAQIRAALSDWHVLVGIALMVGYVLLYVYSLGMAELSLVLPLSAGSYLLGALLSKYYLGEEIKPARWIGTFIITAGVCVIAWSGFSGDSSSDKDDKGKNKSSGAESSHSDPSPS